MAVYLYDSRSFDGWMNLSVDRFFLENLKSDDIMLYFYVNENAVIIGKNQNAWKECNIPAMEKDMVQLVRRHTGGGAVYHDMGNLNFSFIAGNGIYDQDRQFNVILKALRGFGLDGEKSGRNDLLIDGKKFSGNAFAKSGNLSAHHGTLLVSCDMTRLSGYLNPSETKLRAKGVTSVRSRVVNLKELSQDINVDDLREEIIKAFGEEYGEPVIYEFKDEDRTRIREIYIEQSSWEWNFGHTPVFEKELQGRMSFGEVQIFLNVRNGHISEVKVYSDALDTDFPEHLETLLAGKRYDRSEISRALESSEDRRMGEIIDIFESTF
ncbi:MAG: lipoate--protein ligase [Clostridia bacterium]|nr:lipoate--protein ligase [Clostridia bacterium]